MKQELTDPVRREVRSCERDGQPARALVIERTYGTTVDDLWIALTDPERIPRWFMPVSGDLRPGGRYQLTGNASGEITACAPPTDLALTWEYGGAVSWVQVRLADAAGGARMRLEHVALVDDSGMWEQFGPGAVGIGWDLGLLGLAEHLRTGASVADDPAAVAAAVPDGFMEHSSEAWGEADIAAGTPAEVARAAAGRTLAAYTGADAPAEDGSAPAPGA